MARSQSSQGLVSVHPATVLLCKKQVAARLQAEGVYSVASIVCSASEWLTNRALLAFASRHILQGPSHCTQVALECRLRDKNLDRLENLRDFCKAGMTELRAGLGYLCDYCAAAVYKAHMSITGRATVRLGPKTTSAGQQCAQLPFQQHTHSGCWRWLA